MRDRAEQLVREVVQLYGASTRTAPSLWQIRPRWMRWFATIWCPACYWCTDFTRTTWRPASALRSTACVRTSVRTEATSRLIEVAGGVVRLRLLGSCNSCPSSSVTLETAVQDAVQAGGAPRPPESTSKHRIRTR